MKVSYSITKMRNQDQRDRILRVSAWQGWHQARPEQYRRHAQDAYPTRQVRSAAVHRFDELFGGIQHFADKVTPLRELLKTDVPFAWHEDHQRAYDDLKRCIGSESCLSYYHQQKENVLEVDACRIFRVTFIITNRAK